jgi:hypothetical protein
MKKDALRLFLCMFSVFLLVGLVGVNSANSWSILMSMKAGSLKEQSHWAPWLM